MIKKLVLSAVLASASLYSYGQGTIAFFTGDPAAPNPSLSANSVARVTDASTGLPVFGSAFYCQIYAADGANADASTLAAKGAPVNFRASSATSGAAGYVQISGTSQGANGPVPVNTTVTVTAGNAGQVTIQLRAWSSAYTTYANAVNAGAKAGTSIAFNFVPGYGQNPTPDFSLANANPGNSNPSYTGIPTFQVSNVPEPSTIALGVIGAAALLFRRRK